MLNSVAQALNGDPGVSWFPQDHAHFFYVLKGVLAIIATVLLLLHMVRGWERIVSWAQRLRYLSLLYFAMLVAYASAEQVHQTAPVNLRNLGGLVGVALLVVAALVSLHDERRPRCPDVDHDDLGL